jgi:hypothetical protein
VVNSEFKRRRPEPWPKVFDQIFEGCVVTVKKVCRLETPFFWEGNFQAGFFWTGGRKMKIEEIDERDLARDLARASEIEAAVGRAWFRQEEKKKRQKESRRRPKPSRARRARLSRSDYARRVLALFFALPGAPRRRPNAENRRIAKGFHKSGFSLPAVEAAFLLGSLRRLESPALPRPINSLLYFLPICREVTSASMTPAALDEYIGYLRRKLKAAL